MHNVADGYRHARRIFRQELGRETISHLHRPIPVLDWAAIVALPAVFLASAVALAVWPVGGAWIACLILQGFVIQAFAYAVHDLFVHRKVAGAAGYYIGAVFELLIAYLRTKYELYHLEHHDCMNTADDTEAYKQDLDTRWKRVLFMTLPGVLLVRGRLLKPEEPASPHIGSGPLRPPGPLALRRLRFEQRLQWVAIIVAALTAIWWWQLVVFGYLLPLAIITPLASGLRTILEHSEADADNVFNCAVFYRTGLVTGPLFFWDAGDCHIVHHIYPAIPFYRIPQALRLMRPIILAHGARRRSLWDLLRGWFWYNRPHRSVWTGCASPATALKNGL